MDYFLFNFSGVQFHYTMSLEEKYKTIGLNIMYYRRALSLTQSELAEKAKMLRARVSDIECGKGPFNMESIFLLAQALGVDPVRLLQERK